MTEIEIGLKNNLDINKIENVVTFPSELKPCMSIVKIIKIGRKKKYVVIHAEKDGKITLTTSDFTGNKK